MSMFLHRTYYVFRRAADGVRRRPLLHLLSLLTLVAAFMSFAGTLVTAINIDALLGRWVGSGQITVYVKEGATDSDYQRLSSAIEALQGVASTRVVTPSAARKRLVADLGDYAQTAASLPDGAFPGSIEVHLQPRASRDQTVRQEIAARIARVNLVEQVDAYDEWFDTISALSLVGRLAALGLGLLALVVSVMVVASVVRAGISARSREIEVLKLVGATRRFVEAPFLIEGASQALIAMALAVFGFELVFNYVQGMTTDVMPLIGARSLVGLAPKTMACLLGASALAGLFGARLSLSRASKV